MHKAGCIHRKHDIPGCKPVLITTMKINHDWNLSCKITWLRCQLPFLYQYHNDSSQEPDVILTEAASLCYGLMVKNTTGSWHFFLWFWIMPNTLEKHHWCIWPTLSAFLFFVVESMYCDRCMGCVHFIERAA